MAGGRRGQTRLTADNNHGDAWGRPEEEEGGGREGRHEEIRLRSMGMGTSGAARGLLFHGATRVFFYHSLFHPLLFLPRLIRSAVHAVSIPSAPITSVRPPPIAIPVRVLPSPCASYLCPRRSRLRDPRPRPRCRPRRPATAALPRALCAVSPRGPALAAMWAPATPRAARHRMPTACIVIRRLQPLRALTHPLLHTNVRCSLRPLGCACQLSHRHILTAASRPLALPVT